MIWYHRAETISQGLPTAIASGRVTQVMIRQVHPGQVTDELDASLRHNLAVCRDAGVGVIYSEHLFPTRDIDPATLFDRHYLTARVAHVRDTAGKLGASSALDTEFYVGRLVEYRDQSLELKQWQRLQNAVWSAVGKAGQVDYIYPTGINTPMHAYDVLRGLGKTWICEHYYDQRYWPALAYDVRGVHVRTAKGYGAKAVFTVDDLPPGPLFVYTGDPANALAVATALDNNGREGQ